MAHVFVAPHPDDVALSCGGLIASLRELGQAVTIITGVDQMGDAVRGFGKKVPSPGNLPGVAERYWASSRLFSAPG